ncbi:MAG: hypothetical protein L0Y56_19850, partial [Nitrospira sp.]|nr:hypothetical protein [Nitrospira sp.]
EKPVLFRLGKIGKMDKLILLMLVLMVQYLMIAGTYWYKGERGMAIVWLMYSLSLIGFILARKNI